MKTTNKSGFLFTYIPAPSSSASDMLSLSRHLPGDLIYNILYQYTVFSISMFSSMGDFAPMLQEDSKPEDIFVSHHCLGEKVKKAGRLW